ncbi:glucosyltransferase [Exidia glandulosa HHB12029]|uniref:Alpha-1,3-glucosyltransferase n=1 Tax=Exidia glandulosa HHB12029 TaxID=1314781 RepID=A0A165GBS9_EXIGL|nr:glucosyltransferase [Exidia glandulosa HHB12029]
MRAAGMREWTVPIMTLFALCVRWTIGLGTYSGFNTPPMYGDYEAQRHWMELTLNLPMSKWYTYDLQYWGLDYPPLTAYVSWLCGLVGSWIDPSWFALDASRGIETPSSKVYMRATVLVLDALVYLPALFTFVRLWSGHRSQSSQHAALAMLLFQPALLLIDFGHFQYNSVMLGLVIHALNSFFLGRDLLGAVFFVGALCFKQMALYYSPAIFGYLLGRCFSLGWRDGSRLFVQLGITTALSFVIMFAPWLWPPSALLGGPITRIFPFSRGLFEDKVANFWCASDVVLKWRRLLAPSALMRLSTLFTAAGFAPSLVLLVRAGGGRGLALLPYALFCTSMSFFLFSFQVHEKSVLLPLMPLALAMAGDAGIAEWGTLVQNVAVFSMWPLLQRDGQGTQYIALLGLWNYLIGYNPLRVQDSFVRLLSVASYTAIAVLHALEWLVTPPARYPDLFPVLNVLLSAGVFALAWGWGTLRLLQVSWALGALKERESERTSGKHE